MISKKRNLVKKDKVNDLFAEVHLALTSMGLLRVQIIPVSYYSPLVNGISMLARSGVHKKCEDCLQRSISQIIAVEHDYDSRLFFSFPLYTLIISND